MHALLRRAIALRSGRFLVVVLPPLAAFLSARILLSLAAMNVGIDPRHPGAWCRGDCGHYLTIVFYGYHVHPCPEGENAPDDRVCGNTGWFPGYSLLIRLMRAARLTSARRAGLVISTFSTLAVLFVLWLQWLRHWPRNKGIAALAMAAWFPGIVYHHAIFPIALVTLLAVLFLMSLARNRTLPAALTAAAASYNYTTGFLLAPVALGAKLTTLRGLSLRRTLIVAAAALLGTMAVVVEQYRAVGIWGVFLDAQAGYGHGLHDPVTTLVRRMWLLIVGRLDFESSIPVIQSLLVLIWLAMLAATTLRKFASLQPIERATLAYVAVYWLSPLIAGGGVAFHRAEALLLPSVLLARRVSTPLILTCALLSGAVAWALARQFFLSLLA
jgi:hypothetical protein